RMANKIEATRASGLASIRRELSEIDAGDELKPGSRAFEKLKAISARLEDLQERDFQAKELKAEIDRALQQAADGVGGLLGAFAALSKSDDRFE
ncbi:MAG: hypothetical protein JNK82_39795, partial [Myxococcaceae bacterium]|nr:hypothetical protein [Myxococcaceae bacterium]